MNLAVLRHLTIAIALLLPSGFALGTPSLEGNRDKNLNIAVIGAGIAGLTAAVTLQDQGYKNVTVFEKESQVDDPNLCLSTE